MEIYIIRHGETFWNEQGRLQGNTDIELNEKGREAAGTRGRQLEDIYFDVIYSSPLIRAYETACLIRGHRNIPIIRDNRLKEMSFGTYEGRDAKKLWDNQDDPFHYFFNRPELFHAAPEGEEFNDVCLRAKSFLKEVLEPQEHHYKRVMITGHGAVNKALMQYIKNSTLKDYWAGGLQKNCGVVIVRLEDGHYEVIQE